MCANLFVVAWQPFSLQQSSFGSSGVHVMYSPYAKWLSGLHCQMWSVQCHVSVQMMRQYAPGTNLLGIMMNRAKPIGLMNMLSYMAQATQSGGSSDGSSVWGVTHCQENVMQMAARNAQNARQQSLITALSHTFSPSRRTAPQCPSL